MIHLATAAQLANLVVYYMFNRATNCLIYLRFHLDRAPVAPIFFINHNVQSRVDVVGVDCFTCLNNLLGTTIVWLALCLCYPPPLLPWSPATFKLKKVLWRGGPNGLLLCRSALPLAAPPCIWPPWWNCCCCCPCAYCCWTWWWCDCWDPMACWLRSRGGFYSLPWRLKPKLDDGRSRADFILTF